MAQRYEKEMKKADKKNIIIKYKQYLKLEKSLSANTVEAYLTDLDKLFAFLELENGNFFSRITRHRHSPAFPSTHSVRDTLLFPLSSA